MITSLESWCEVIISCKFQCGLINWWKSGSEVIISWESLCEVIIPRESFCKVIHCWEKVWYDTTQACHTTQHSVPPPPSNLSTHSAPNPCLTATVMLGVIYCEYLSPSFKSKTLSKSERTEYRKQYHDIRSLQISQYAILFLNNKMNTVQLFLMILENMPVQCSICKNVKVCGLGRQGQAGKW